MEYAPKRINLYTVANPACQAGSIITFMRNASLLPAGYLHSEKSLLECMKNLRALPSKGKAASLPLAEGRILETPGGSAVMFHALSFRGEDLVSVSVDSPQLAGFVDGRQMASAMREHGTNLRIIGIADAKKWAAEELSRFVELDGEGLLCNYRLIAPDGADGIVRAIANLAQTFDSIRSGRIVKNGKLEARVDAESDIEKISLGEWALENVVPYFNFAQTVRELQEGKLQMTEEVLQYASKFMEHIESVDAKLKEQVSEYVQIVDIIKAQLIDLRRNFFAWED